MAAIAQTSNRTGRPARALAALAVALLLCGLAAAAADAGPRTTRLVRAVGEIVPIPAAIPHEEGDMVDRRIVADLRWMAARFPIYVTDGYSGPLPNGVGRAGCKGCHVRNSDHHNGLAVDIVPVNWSDRCDARWRGITRLARWAEPRQNRPAPPFRWVGYNGDSGHGCGHHLHISWEHAPVRPFEIAEWVSVFPVTSAELQEARRGKVAQTAYNGPRGGISSAATGGLSARGD